MNLDALEITYNDFDDDDHVEVSVYWIDPTEDKYKDLSDHLIYQAAIRAGGVMSRVGMLLLPHLERERAEHRCHPLTSAYACSINGEGSARLDDLGWVGLCVTVPRKRGKVWTKLVRETLDEVLSTNRRLLTPRVTNVIALARTGAG